MKFMISTVNLMKVATLQPSSSTLLLTSVLYGMGG